VGHEFEKILEEKEKVLTVTRPEFKPFVLSGFAQQVASAQ